VPLVYARNWADRLGLTLTAATLLFVGAQGVWARRRRKAAAAGPAPAVTVGDRPVETLDACDLPPAGRRWGWMVPAAVLLVLVAVRPLAGRGGRSAKDAGPLYEQASRAYAAERFADAAEYARHALALNPAGGTRGELLNLRGESLLAAGQPRPAAEAFETLLSVEPRGPYAAEALYGAGRARAALGESEAASGHRARLLKEFPETPWARRLRSDGLGKP
jgi:TolA-binding protein